MAAETPGAHILSVSVGIWAQGYLERYLSLDWPLTEQRAVGHLNLTDLQ